MFGITGGILFTFILVEWNNNSGSGGFFDIINFLISKYLLTQALSISQGFDKEGVLQCEGDAADEATMIEYSKDS